MSNKHARTAIVAVLFVLIMTCAVLLVRATARYMDEPFRSYILVAAFTVTLAYVVFETVNFVRLFARKNVKKEEKKTDAASALVLMSENGVGIRVWDLQGRTGIVIGRAHEGADIDVDLAETEFSSFISDEHAVMNFTPNGWFLADVGSRNGTAVMRAGSEQKLALAPGEPVPVKQGDFIFIAEETVLAVR